jgi:hypothetical protein
VAGTAAHIASEVYNTTPVAARSHETRVPIVLRLFVPNLAAMIAAATLIYCLFVFHGGERLFRDSDSGWHIRNGESILSSAQLPRTDPYSFSKPGAPWVAWEWGVDALMGALYRADGLRGVTSAFALIIAVCMWMWCRVSFAAGGDFFLAALLAAPAITSVSLHWLARPHVIGWVFALAVLWWAERGVRSQSGTDANNAKSGFRIAVTAALFTALWANIHGSFLLAPAIALVYAAGHFARPFVWNLERASEWAKSRWFLLAAVSALVGSLANPYGWNLHAHIFSYLWDEDLTSRVAEFQSFNFHDPDAVQVTLAMFVAACGAVVALSRKKLAQSLLMGALVWGGLRSARLIPLIALLALPLANGAIADALRSVSGLRPSVERWLRRVFEESAGLRHIDMRLSGAGFLAIVAIFSLGALRAPANTRTVGFSPERFPVAAAEAVAKLPLDAKILAPDSYGGYLIYRFNGVRKVYFDGRSDFYGAAFMKQYLTLIQARPGWQKIADEHGFTHALLPEDSALRAALGQAGWTTLYRDHSATLLQRSQAPPVKAGVREN